jgi:hypothetical protein
MIFLSIKKNTAHSPDGLFGCRFSKKKIANNIFPVLAKLDAQGVIRVIDLFFLKDVREKMLFQSRLLMPKRNST